MCVYSPGGALCERTPCYPCPRLAIIKFLGIDTERGSPTGIMRHGG